MGTARYPELLRRSTFMPGWAPGLPDASTSRFPRPNVRPWPGDEHAGVVCRAAIGHRYGVAPNIN